MFQAIINDPFMMNSVILVFANKQDMVCPVGIFRNLYILLKEKLQFSTEAIRTLSSNSIDNFFSNFLFNLVSCANVEGGTEPNGGM